MTKKPAASTGQAPGRQNPVTIEVDPDDWGDASQPDIQRLLEDVTGQLVCQVAQCPTGRIHVQCHPLESAPRIIYRTSPEQDYVIWLTVRNRLWSQFAYQFAHEFCHLLSDFERLQLVPNQWFHESLCELASLFVLKQMALTWRSAPPFPNWSDYAPHLGSYAQDVICRDEHQLPPGVSLGEWFHANEPRLRTGPYQRALNGLVAVQLLPLLLEQPSQWESVRHLPDTDECFAVFLSQWRTSCPPAQQDFVTRVAGAFGIVLT